MRERFFDLLRAIALTAGCIFIGWLAAQGV